ncbi:Strictosidine synthase [Acorus calamus]|uniref:Strictosidine synthase n=1 Tax=Acorus calamus TaxID=4465 RepID=A0AAV9DK51_ACOCL|nr:Strictosidine synthase [Acorus calamus]
MGTKPINNNATFFFLVVLLSYASRGLSLQQTTIDDLQYYKRLLLTAVVGPESLAFDRDGGGPYTGVSDGQILKWHGTDRGWSDFAVPSRNRDYALLVMSGESTGRLMRYNPTNNQLTVLLRGVTFPNGVALSRDNTFLVYTETTNRRVVKYWLRGPNAGSSEPFADDLPGFPDNVKRNSKGEFWVALSNGNPTGWDALADRAVAVRLSEEGVVVEVKEDEVGIMRSVSEVSEVNGTLWIGSVDNPFVGVCEL